MTRRKRLEEIRRIRSIRDELFIQNNLGRCRYLMVRFNGVKRVITRQQFRNNSVELEMGNGYDYKEYGDNAFVRLTEIIYKKYLCVYLQKYCN